MVMSFDDSEIKETNEKLETRLSNDRLEWKNRISEIILKIKDMNKLSDCQVEMLSYRQILLDKITDFKTMIFKRNATWDKYYRAKYREYTLNYDIKLSGSEKNQFIKADLSSLKTQIEMLQSHVDYYHECIKTLDNMAFAIRNRIRLEEEHT